ncbi:signal recognition particle subunit SRP14 [Plasmodium ovale curtisi]|uniref:Signal recognition particle subunit SRP14 n=1 Tax=Plasmodium ovale curtisi TaxID=864141 RepID=A0A1A8W4P6_PLAOA|nr:signal recognition particle subunit SRP14 [Plasmodium ovale curtisi]
MVLLSNSAFIEELRKLCTREDENKKASVWITMKRVKRSMIKKMVPKKEGSEKRNDRRNKKMNRDDGKVCDHTEVCGDQGKEKGIISKTKDQAKQRCDQAVVSIRNSPICYMTNVLTSLFITYK